MSVPAAGGISRVLRLLAALAIMMQSVPTASSYDTMMLWSHARQVRAKHIGSLQTDRVVGKCYKLPWKGEIEDIDPPQSNKKGPLDALGIWNYGPNNIAPIIAIYRSPGCHETNVPSAVIVLDQNDLDGYHVIDLSKLPIKLDHLNSRGMQATDWEGIQIRLPLGLSLEDLQSSVLLYDDATRGFVGPFKGAITKVALKNVPSDASRWRKRLGLANAADAVLEQGLPDGTTDEWDRVYRSRRDGYAAMGVPVRNSQFASVRRRQGSQSGRSTTPDPHADLVIPWGGPNMKFDPPVDLQLNSRVDEWENVGLQRQQQQTTGNMMQTNNMMFAQNIANLGSNSGMQTLPFVSNPYTQPMGQNIWGNVATNPQILQMATNRQMATDPYMFMNPYMASSPYMGISQHTGNQYTTTNPNMATNPYMTTGKNMAMKPYIMNPYTVVNPNVGTNQNMDTNQNAGTNPNVGTDPNIDTNSKTGANPGNQDRSSTYNSLNDLFNPEVNQQINAPDTKEALPVKQETQSTDDIVAEILRLRRGGTDR
ncbi:hypothetical protein DRE_06818 [Drechslerella stenobrocha 248]|uniref:Uncharacterized protein n=1 Tax=Drechslerella stenobrocha 248 TaxID=1043628 RepID=W7I6L8_9PEZI|nr:hypothetical protein DRE_06818 [Drechslerella stenobrocha 248]